MNKVSKLRPRIAFVSYHTCPLEQPGQGDAGGLNVFVLDFAQALARRGVRVDIFTRLTSPGGPPVVIAGPGVRVIHLEAGPAEPLSKTELADHIESFGMQITDYAERCGVSYSLVHSHYWMSGMAARRVAARFGIPHVHTSHSLQAALDRSGVAEGTDLSSMRRSSEREILNGVDIVTASTEFEFEILTNEYGVTPERICMLSPGFDPAVFNPEAGADGEPIASRKDLASFLTRESRVVVAAGRIQPLKGFDLAVNAVERLRASNPALSDTALLICGGPSGPNGESELLRIKELISATSRPAGTLLAGSVSRRQMAEILRRADLVLVTSKSESFGMIALESLACGTPVVATKAGGVGELIQDGVTGRVLDSRDPDDLARIMGELLGDPERLTSMGEAASASVAEMTWDNVASYALAEFSKLLDAAEVSRSL